MIKWLLLAGIVYFIYRFYLPSAALKKGKDTSGERVSESSNAGEEGFTEYEELD